MQNPRPVVDALLPDALRVGGLALRPLNLAETILLQKIRSPFLGLTAEDAPAKAPRKARRGLAPAAAAPAAPAPPPRFPELETLSVLFILTRSDAELDSLFFGFDAEAFTRAVWGFAKQQAPSLLVGVEAKLVAVFSRATDTIIGGGGAGPATLADAKKKDTWDSLVDRGKSNGLGWGLTLLDTLCHEYSWSLEYAMNLSLAKAFALFAAISARYGQEPAGPTYEERDLLSRLDRERGNPGGWAA